MDRTVRANNGFTLVELLVVICIAAILMAIAVYNYNHLTRLSSINRDLNSMAAFLQEKRIEAFSQKEGLDVDATATQLSATDTITRTMDFGSITLENNFTPSLGTFTINTRGLYSLTGNIRLTDMSLGSARNCVVIARTRVRMGVWNGATCDPE